MDTRALTIGLALALGAALHAPAWAQDNSCATAFNSQCDEGVLYGPHLCEPLTDTADCANAEIWPSSDEYPISPWDLAARDPDWLRLTRNEIYARHGFAYSSADLAALFGARDWYQPVGQSVALSQVEQQNVALIQAAEAEPMALLGLPAVSGSWLATLVGGDAAPAAVLISPDATLIERPDTGADFANRLLPHDHDMAYAWTPGEQPGVAYAIGQEPMPLTPRLLALYRVEAEPIGGGRHEGYAVTRYRLVGIDEMGEEIFRGEAQITANGVIVAARYRLVFFGCCGDEPAVQDHVYRLEGLAPTPGPLDLAPPPLRFMLAG